MRDAANGADFRHELHDRFGLDARIISGDEEARLTFLGATAGAPAGDGPLVIDIGGGCTEYVDRRRPAATPTSASRPRPGSVRQTERHLHDDPPTPTRTSARSCRGRRAIIDDAIPADVRARVDAGIAVAGTATSLAAIDQQLDPYDPDKVARLRAARRSAATACSAELAARAARRAQRRHGPPPRPRADDRRRRGHPARVDALLRARSVEVSEADILHGAALDAASKTA